MKTYKINLKRSEVSENDLMYINLYRQMLYQVDENIVPLELIIENSEDLKTYIDPQNLAYRMGLLKFNKNMPLEEVFFEISNTTDQNKEIYGKDITFKKNKEEEKEIKLMTPEVLILVLPPKSEIKGHIRFIKGKGIENGRFLSYAGFSYNLEENSCVVMVDSLFDVNEENKKVKVLVEDLIKEDET